MQYKITITKLVENPNYAAERERFENQRNSYPRGNFENQLEPCPTMEETSLHTILDEAQFKAVQKACIETMK